MSTMALQRIDDVAPEGGQPPRHWGGFLEASLLIQAVHPDLSGVLLELQPGSSELLLVSQPRAQDASAVLLWR